MSTAHIAKLIAVWALLAAVVAFALGYVLGIRAERRRAAREAINRRIR